MVNRIIIIYTPIRSARASNKFYYANRNTKTLISVDVPMNLITHPLAQPLSRLTAINMQKSKKAILVDERHLDI